MSRRIFLTTVPLVGLGAAACSSQSKTGASPQKPYTIGFVPGTLTGADFYITAKNAATTEATRLHQNIVVAAPAQFSATLQIPIIDALIARHIDGLIVAPCDSAALIGPLQRAQNAGIPIITFDTYIGDGDYVHGSMTFPLSYIGSDNALGGKIMAQALMKSIGGVGKVYLQSLQPGVSTTDQREQAFREAIIATKGAVMLVEVGYDDGDVSKASAQTAAVLQTHPDLAGIAATNLFSSMGMVAAIKAAQRVRTIRVAYFDASQQAIMDLRNNVIDLVIAQQPAVMGKTSLDLMVKALSGETIPKKVPTGYVVITKDTLDSPEVQAALYQQR